MGQVLDVEEVEAAPAADELPDAVEIANVVSGDNGQNHRSEPSERFRQFVGHACLHPNEITVVAKIRQYSWALFLAFLALLSGGIGSVIGVGNCVGTTQAQVDNLREDNLDRVREDSEMRVQLRETEQRNVTAHQEILNSVRRMEGQLDQLLQQRQP